MGASGHPEQLRARPTDRYILFHGNRDVSTTPLCLVNNDRRQDWLVEKVHQRLREEVAKLDLRLNEEKSRIVDLSRGESFGFLGFDFRRLRSLRGRWRPQYTPKQKKRTALLQELKGVFRRYRSQRVEVLIAAINSRA